MPNARQRHLATFRELQSLLSGTAGPSPPSASTEAALVDLFTRDAVLETASETYLGHEGVRRWLRSGEATGNFLQLLDSAPLSVSQDPRDGSVVAVTKAIVQHCRLGGIVRQQNFCKYEFENGGLAYEESGPSLTSSSTSPPSSLTSSSSASAEAAATGGRRTHSLSKICRCLCTGTTPLPQCPQFARYYQLPIKPDCGPRALAALGDIALPLVQRFLGVVCHLASHFRLSTGTLHIAVVCAHRNAAFRCAAQLDSEIFHALRLWTSPIAEASGSPPTAAHRECVGTASGSGCDAAKESVRGSDSADLRNSTPADESAADDDSAANASLSCSKSEVTGQPLSLDGPASQSERPAVARCCPGIALRSRHGGISGPGCCAVLAILPTGANGHASIQERLPVLARRLAAIPGYLSLTVLQPVDNEVHLISQYATPASQLDAAAAIRSVWGDLLTDLLSKNPERTPGDGIFATALGSACVHMGLAEFGDTATRDAVVEEYARACGRHRCDSAVGAKLESRGGGGYTDVVWPVDSCALRFVSVAMRREWEQSRKAFEHDVVRGKLADMLAAATRRESTLIGASSDHPSIRESLVPAVRGCVPLPGMLPGGVVVFMQLLFPIVSAANPAEESNATSSPKRMANHAAHFAASVNVWATAGGATLSSPTGSSRGLVVHVVSEKECWLVQTGTTADLLRDHAVAVENKSIMAAFQTASNVFIDVVGQVEPLLKESINGFSEHVAKETTHVVARFAPEYCGTIYH